MFQTLVFTFNELKRCKTSKKKHFIQPNVVVVKHWPKNHKEDQTSKISKRKHSPHSKFCFTYQAETKYSCTDCWCSKSPGRSTVLKSFSNSAASHNRSTYSLCVRWSFRHAFWYLSLTSSNFRPPRPAAQKRGKLNKYILLNVHQL